jgi:hypothetical protein
MILQRTDVLRDRALRDTQFVRRGAKIKPAA